MNNPMEVFLLCYIAAIVTFILMKVEK